MPSVQAGVTIPELGDPKAGDPGRKYQEVISVSGCGFKWRAYLSVDAKECGREVRTIMQAHQTICRDCHDLAARTGTPR